ncbi:MAG TPA: 30S ribosomal protein S2 [Candidatus Sulfotelmatobacter sp.]|nr:30S ribosomal protein S2 [Candidatus Sulfotelmatobacter sp.]
MREITLEELLEAGCHFGHQVTRSNPKARDFVFEARDNIQIIDLAKTKEGLDEAAQFVKEIGQKGQSLLIVGTKRQARDIIEQEVKRVKEMLESDKKGQEGKLFSITQRWIGGILTNFPEVSKNFKKLKDIKERLANAEEKAKYTKKEVGQWVKEQQRLESFYKGVFEMTGKPDALFIVDSHLEDLAVREAASVGVRTVAIVDTNSDPYVIDHPIPANDDAVGSIKLIVTHILDSWAEGIRSQKEEEKKTEIKKEEKIQKPKEEKPKKAVKAKKETKKKEKK